MSILLRLLGASAFLFGIKLAAAEATLFSGGTIIAFDSENESFNVIRNGSILVVDDRIKAIGATIEASLIPNASQTVDVTDQIITPGFIDTHRHSWQTAFKTLGSNTTLLEYYARYFGPVPASHFRPEDVYLGQILGLYESLNAGVTTILDHAHHTWSNATTYAGLNASIASGARVFWAYEFQNTSTTNYTVADQIPIFREIAEGDALAGSATELGIAYDYFSPNPNVREVQQVIALAREYNVSVLTTHCLAAPWVGNNLPEDLHAFGILNDSIPVVFSHGSFMTATSTELLRSTNQYLSITPESEMHYGHTHPHSFLMQDQAALGVDTHFTYSADILTQARIWLQSARYRLYSAVLDQWQVPSKNPMSVVQALRLATRAGGLALRRADLGVLSVGAKADLVVWNARDSLSMLGWDDPVAAVMLHASTGDVFHVMVDGKFVKKDGKLLAPGYKSVREQFEASAAKIRKIWRDMPYPVIDAVQSNGYLAKSPLQADTLPGEGTGYGDLFLN